MTNQSLPDGFDQAMQKKSVGNFSQKYNCLENQNCSFKVKDCIRWCDTLLSTRSSNWTLWFQIKSFKNASHLIKNIGICTGNLCRYTTIVLTKKNWTTDSSPIALSTLAPIGGKINQCHFGDLRVLYNICTDLCINFRGGAKKQPVPWPGGTG